MSINEILISESRPKSINVDPNAERDHVRELLQGQAHEPHRIERLDRHRRHGHDPDLGRGQVHDHPHILAPAHLLEGLRVDGVVRKLGREGGCDLVNDLLVAALRQPRLVLVHVGVRVRHVSVVYLVRVRAVVLEGQQDPEDVV